MAAQKEMIRIRLKAYDHQLIDQSADLFARTIKNSAAGLDIGINLLPLSR